MGRIGLGTEHTYPRTERTGTEGPGMERTGFRPLYTVPILYLVSLYACPILIMAFDLEIVNYDTGDSSGLLLLQIPVCLAIANIVAAAVGRRNESRAFLLNSAVLLKYGLIPFYLVGGLLVALAALSSLIPVPFMIFVGPTIAMSFSFIGWLLMLSGSAYSLAYLKASRRAGALPATLATLSTVLQFFFVADVIDVMVLTWREGRWRKATVAVAIVIGLVALALLAGLVWVIVTVTSSAAASSAGSSVAVASAASSAAYAVTHAVVSA